MEPLEDTLLPWAQGVGRSNRPAPTIFIKDLRQLSPPSPLQCSWQFPIGRRLQVRLSGKVGQAQMRVEVEVRANW